MVEIKVGYVDHMGTDLTPVNAARISFFQESASLSERDEKLIKYLAVHQHNGVFEHQLLTVLVEVPLYVRSQWHRHRTQAYNEVSRRYTDEGLEFYLPPVDDIRSQSKSNKQASAGPIESQEAQVIHNLMENHCETSRALFERLIEMGVSREQARGILPQCLMTKYYATASLRNWVHFLKLRLDPHAQKEIRMAAEQVGTIAKGLWPVSYAAMMEES